MKEPASLAKITAEGRMHKRIAAEPGDIAADRLDIGKLDARLAMAIGCKLAQLPLAAYYCAFDPKTPLKVKGILLAALAYFVMPIDLIPDFIASLGFTDDMTVLITAVSLISTHMRDEHRDKARTALARLRQNWRPA